MTQTVEIQLTQGYTAIIDAVDADLAVLKWRVNVGRHTYYALHSTTSVGVKRRTIQLHRVILSRMLGRELLRTEQVDHVNLNGLDNRRENLRLATHAQNKRNQGVQINSASGLKGVTWHKQNKKWRATIQVNLQHLHLGYFETAEAAYEAYCTAADKHHGEFAHYEQVSS